MKPLSIPALAKLADLTPARMWQLQKEGKIPLPNVGKGKQARYEDSEALRDWILVLKVGSGRGWRERRMGEKRVRHISISQAISKAEEIIEDPCYSASPIDLSRATEMLYLFLQSFQLDDDKIGPELALAISLISLASRPRWKNDQFIIGPKDLIARQRVMRAIAKVFDGMAGRYASLAPKVE